jgi:hypothetical protein
VETDYWAKAADAFTTAGNWGLGIGAAASLGGARANPGVRLVLPVSFGLRAIGNMINGFNGNPSYFTSSAADIGSGLASWFGWRPSPSRELRAARTAAAKAEGNALTSE